MILFITISLIAAVIYLLNKYFFSYWTKRNVLQVEPTFLVGNIGRAFILKAAMSDIFGEIYEKFKKQRFIGGYLLYKPMLITNDPVLIQDILIRDFSSFHDRPMPDKAAKNFPLVGNLFNLRGQKWRDIRVKLTPTFTSGKLKAMLPIIRDCCKVLQDYIIKNIKNGHEVCDLKDLLGKLSVNIISSTAFGIDNDCINEPENIFYKTAPKIFEPSLRNKIVNSILMFHPDLFTKLKINPFVSEVGDLIFSMVNQIVDYRENNNYQRNDFMQLLIELKNMGYVSADKKGEDEIDWKLETNEDKTVAKFTMDDIAAQAFSFLAAGYESTSSTLTFCMFELARNQKIQRKVQEEIDRVMKEAESEEFTYEMMAKMKYLECCIDETLRKYPVAPVLNRVSTSDYKIPDTDVIIETGTSIFIPIIGLHRDPEIYENPMEFKPERFLDSPTGNPNISAGITYAPFGDGPRICIASRLGKLQNKIGIAMLLQKLNFEQKDKSLESMELTFHPNIFLLAPQQKLSWNISLRN